MSPEPFDARRGDQRSQGGRRLGWMLVTVLALALTGCEPSVERNLEQAWERYNAATSAVSRLEAGEAILASGDDVADVASRLRQGRTYEQNVTRGWIIHQLVGSDGVEHSFHVYVPDAYDPNVPTTVLFELHGGSLQSPVPPEEYLIGRAIWQPSADTFGWILAYPMADAGATWFDDIGQRNLLAQLEFVKRTYNVDENRVFFSGYSSGGTGTVWQAAHNPTPWAGFLSFNGYFDLDRLEAGASFPRNLLNRPLRATNGLADGIIPVETVEPFIRQLQASGVDLTWQTYPVAHNVSFFAWERPQTEAFIERIERDPHRPDVVWETDSVSVGRCDWVRIDAIADVGNDAAFDDLNVYRPEDETGFGASLAYQGAAGLAVVGVQPGSIAHRAAVKVGDRVVRIGDSDVATAADMDAATASLPPGSSVEIEVSRGGEIAVLTGTVPRGEPAYERPELVGTIEVHADGNQIEVRVACVAHYTLLLSSEQFDLSSPITVTTNGELSYSAVVAPNLRFMLEQAAQDSDRTTVYEAKIEIDVPER